MPVTTDDADQGRRERLFELGVAVALVALGVVVIWQTRDIRVSPMNAKIGPRVIPYVVGSGLVRADQDRVQVFLLVDQSRTNKAERLPVVYKNWVTVTMERVDGDWLVPALDT